MDAVEHTVVGGVDEAVHVLAGDAEVGLGEHHLDVGQEPPEEGPLDGHGRQLVAEPRGPRRRQARSHAVPAGDVLAGLRPPEHPRDGPQGVEARRRAAAPSGRARADVEVGQLVDGRRLEEVRDERRVLDQLAVRRHGGLRDEVHHGVPPRQPVGAQAGLGVEQGAGDDGARR